MARTKKQEAAAAAKEWAEAFKPGIEVAVVQDDGTRRLALVVGAPKLDAELKANCKVKYFTATSEKTEVQEGETVNTKRIRHRAIETKKTSNLLRVMLTNDEKLETGASVADGLANVGSLEAELATVKKQYQGKIQAATAEVSSKSELLRNGYEIRPVACTLTMDFDTGFATEVRNDTGKQTERRALRKEERERELALFPEAQQPTAEKPAEAKPEGDGKTESTAIAPTEEEIEAALKHCVFTQRVSSASIQRACGVGFTTAFKITEELEKRGMVTAAQGPQMVRELTDKAPQPEGTPDGEGGETFPLAE